MIRYEIAFLDALVFLRDKSFFPIGMISRDFLSKYNG